MTRTNSDIHVVYHSAMALSSLAANDKGRTARHLAIVEAYSRGYRWRLIHFHTIGKNPQESDLTGVMFDNWEPW